MLWEARFKGSVFMIYSYLPNSPKLSSLKQQLTVSQFPRVLKPGTALGLRASGKVIVKLLAMLWSFEGASSLTSVPIDRRAFPPHHMGLSMVLPQHGDWLLLEQGIQKRQAMLYCLYDLF